MIRWFALRFLDGKEVIRLILVEKRVHDIVFSQGVYKKMDFGHIIMQHFKASKIPEAIVKSELTYEPRILDRSIFSKIHHQYFNIVRLQNAINLEF